MKRENIKTNVIGSVFTFHCSKCGELNEYRKPMIHVSFLNDARKALRDILEIDKVPNKAKEIAEKALPKAIND